MREFSGVDTTSAVTLAPIAFATAIPCFIATLDSSEPSVGSKMCLYMLRLVLACCYAQTIEAECIDMNQRRLVLRSGRKACDKSFLPFSHQDPTWRLLPTVSCARRPRRLPSRRRRRDGRADQARLPTAGIALRPSASRRSAG